MKRMKHRIMGCRYRISRGAAHGIRRLHHLVLIAIFFLLCNGDRASWASEPRQETSGSITSVPLAPADSADASSPSPLFEDLSSHRTGIDFVYRWDKSVVEDYDLEKMMLWSGVCIGDYDRDGLPDVLLTRPKDGCRLYKNLGDFRFRDVTKQTGIDADNTWTTGASFADINNDGHLDLYVCAVGSNNLLYVNQGDGTYEERAGAYGLDYKGASAMIAFSDYDRDGDLDAYLLTYAHEKGGRVRIAEGKKLRSGEVMPGDYYQKDEHGKIIDVKPELQAKVKLIWAGDEFTMETKSEPDRLYRNNGDGTFSDVTDASGMHDTDMGLSATWWDYDGDNWPDLYVANDFYGWDRLYRNNHDGTFTDDISNAVPHMPWFSMGSDVADLNNDGRFDFMASDMAGTTHLKQKLSMGSMNNEKWFLVGAEPRQYMRNAVYLNTGTRRFMEVAYLMGLASTDWTWSIKFADLDNDGMVDLFVSNGMTRDWGNSDLMARVNAQGGKFTAAGKLFMMMQPKKSDENMVFRNMGNLNFEQIGDVWGLNRKSVSFGAATGDLDGDGDLDLVVNNFEEPAAVYRNRSTSGHRVGVRLVGRESNRDGIGATVRIRTENGLQIRYLTLSRGFMSANEPVIHFGLGECERIDEMVITWPSGRRQSFIDLDADRSYTVVESVESAPEMDTQPSRQRIYEPVKDAFTFRHRETPFDDFERQPLLPRKLSQLGPGLAWGDVDGDGDDDLYVGSASGQSAAIYINRGGGQFDAQTLLSGKNDPFAGDAMREDMAPLFFDADSDGDLDLYIVSGSVECLPDDELLRDRLYINDGRGRFEKANSGRLPDVRDSGSVAVAGDLDRDGDLDLFVGGRSIPGQYPALPTSRLLMNHQGSFTDRTAELAPGLGQSGLVTSALWSDVNQDGWPDLLVTCEWGPVRAFVNDGGGKLADRTTEAGLDGWSGWWNGIAGRDLDGDGDIDYVVTNFGLNTPYSGSVENPALLYYGDFTPDGSGAERPRIIEVMFENGIAYPFRGKSCSTHALPSLGNKFTLYEEFADASLEDVYSPRCLSDAQEFTATTFESAVLINDGSGRFNFRPLPRLAQASPGFGVVLTEVNGDAHADLFIVQNFFGSQPEVGNFDGGVGLLLRGDGDCRFTPVWPDESGLVVPGDATALTTTDLDGDAWPDFVVAVNDGLLQAFRHQGKSTNRILKLRLEADPGNPTAVGARVTLQLEDQLPQTAEQYAGGGYLSQSSSELVFGLGCPGKSAKLSVVWPDGTTTLRTVGDDERSITIKKSSSYSVPHSR
jgi:hypothetical protein